MRAKIDINEVEMRTKIRAKYLRAIENEEWDLLPGDVYVKSFLRTYGDYLGLDSRELLDEYRRRYERPSDHEMRPIGPPGRERERRAKTRSGIPPWLIIGAVLVAIVAALFIIGGGAGTNTTTPTTTTTATHRTGHRHHTGGAALAGRSSKKTRKPPATDVKLQLVATGAVYVCLVNGTGHKLIPGQIFQVGETIPTEVAPKLLLVLGNNSVKMTVNGQAVAVAPSANPIGFQLLPTGHSTLPAAQQPSCT